MQLLPIQQTISTENFDTLVVGYIKASELPFVIINSYSEFLNAIAESKCSGRIVIIENLDEICQKLKWENSFQRIQFMLASQNAKVLIYREIM